MSDYEDAVSTLAAELAAVEGFVGGLSPDDWNRPTLLEPFDAGAPPWTVKELVAHIDISIGLTLGFLDSIQAGQPGRDRVSFFIADRSQVAPVVYDYAKGLAGQHTAESLRDKLSETFRATVVGARDHPRRHRWVGLLRADATRRMDPIENRRGCGARTRPHRCRRCTCHFHGCAASPPPQRSSTSSSPAEPCPADPLISPTTWRSSVPPPVAPCTPIHDCPSWSDPWSNARHPIGSTSIWRRALLQRARLADAEGGVWEAADTQWWWRRDQHDDRANARFWIDGDGTPAGAVIFTDWGGHVGLRCHRSAERQATLAQRTVAPRARADAAVGAKAHRTKALSRGARRRSADAGAADRCRLHSWRRFGDDVLDAGGRPPCRHADRHRLSALLDGRATA